MDVIKYENDENDNISVIGKEICFSVFTAYHISQMSR